MGQRGVYTRPNHLHIIYKHSPWKGIRKEGTVLNFISFSLPLPKRKHSNNFPIISTYKLSTVLCWICATNYKMKAQDFAFFLLLGKRNLSDPSRNAGRKVVCKWQKCRQASARCEIWPDAQFPIFWHKKLKSGQNVLCKHWRLSSSFKLTSIKIRKTIKIIDVGITLPHFNLSQTFP